jgi:hypothetical protein
MTFCQTTDIFICEEETSQFTQLSQQLKVMKYGEQKLMGENLKVVQGEFSTLG